MIPRFRIFAAFIRRDWTIAVSYRLPFVVVVGSSGFLLLLLYEASKLVTINPATVHKDAVIRTGYFGYAVIGIAVLQIVYSAVQSFAQQIRQEQTTGTLEVLLATPTSPSIVILGSALYDLIQPTIVSILMVTIGVLSGGIHLVVTPMSILAAVASLVGLLAMFTGLGILVAAFTVVFKQGEGVVSLLVILLGILGGAYFPISQLPQPIKGFAEVLPFTWGIDVLRYSLLLGQVEVAKLIGLLSTGVVLLPVSLFIFHIGVQASRRKGTLAVY